MAEKIILYLLLHLVGTCVCTRGEGYPSLPYKNLDCYNDFNRNLTCFWNSTYGDTECTIHADKSSRYNSYNGSCKLEPVDLARPLQKKCSVVFKDEWKFMRHHTLTIDLNCNNIQRLSINYRAVNYVKLNPPPKPNVNLTTINWSCQAQEHIKFTHYMAEMQWKQEGQPWILQSHAHLRSKECQLNCTAELTDDLILGEWYEARVRVRPSRDSMTWSEWSPILSWKSETGKVKSTEAQTSEGVTWSVWRSSLCVLGTLAVLIIFIWIDKTRWVYIIKRIRGPPLPSPEKSSLRHANFQNLVSPHWSSESYYFLSKQVDIVPVQMASPQDVDSPCGLYAALQEKMKNSQPCYESSNFSNPSYTHPCSPPAISPSSSNLDACDADTPYGPVGCQRAEENGDDVNRNVVLQQLLSRSSNSGPVPVVFEYEKVESQEQRLSLKCQGLDSGCGKESCERMLEEGGIGATNGPNKVAEQTVEVDKIDFQKLFGSTRILNEGSIQVCSGYEQVQKLQRDSRELSSLDSGVSSGVEDQVSQEESLEDTDSESNHLLYSPSPFPTAAQ